MGPIWDAELRVWDAKNFGLVSPGTHRNKFVKKSLYGYSKKPSQWDSSFEHPKHKFKLMGKEINAFLGAQTMLIFTYVLNIFLS